MARTYSPELKAQVIAEWNLGTAKNEIARKFDVPRGTVQQWTRGVDPAAVLSPQKREDLGELVFDYLAAGLKALISQAITMGDPEWFKGQGATAHFIHGTLADKLVIIFQGVERGQSDTGQADEAGA